MPALIYVQARSLKVVYLAAHIRMGYAKSGQRAPLAPRLGCGP